MNNEYKENLSSELWKLVKAYYITLVLSNMIFPDMITYLFHNVDNSSIFAVQFSKYSIFSENNN